MGVRVIVREDAAGRDWLGIPGQQERRIAVQTLLEAWSMTVWGAVVPLTPVGVTGIARSSWIAMPVRGVGGDVFESGVGSPELHVEVLEEGRRAGARMPPPNAIARWVEVKLGGDVDPFVIARSIGRKGIAEQRMLRTAIDQTTGLRTEQRRSIVGRALGGS